MTDASTLFNWPGNWTACLTNFVKASDGYCALDVHLSSPPFVTTSKEPSQSSNGLIMNHEYSLSLATDFAGLN